MIPADDLQAAVLLDYSSQPDLPWDQRGSARSEAQKSEVALSGVNAHTCILASTCVRVTHETCVHSTHRHLPIHDAEPEQGLFCQFTTQR